LNTILVCLWVVAKVFITQNVNVQSVVSKICKMNWQYWHKSEREIEVAEAANVACSFLLPKKSKEHYQMAYNCFVWFNFCQLLSLRRYSWMQKKTGNENFPNVNLVVPICQLIVYFTIPIKYFF
jgi:hypothetical protein